MSAQHSKKDGDAKKWSGPKRLVSVADEHTERFARAIAKDMTWGENENDGRARELEVAIEVGHGAGEDSEVFVKCRATDFASGEPAKTSEFGSIRFREFAIEEAQLGDLPLLVLALQEAIRIGVEQGAFPEIRGDRLHPPALEIVRSATGGSRGGSVGRSLPPPDR